MPKQRPITVGDRLAWRDIQPDGTEDERAGTVWAAAQSLAGMQAWWVVPDGGPLPVLVARSSRRHLVGRAFNIQRRRVSDGTMEWLARWNPKGGRYVDVGEWFRETDARSRFRRKFTRPAYVSVPKMDAATLTDLNAFVNVCERLAAGQRVDDLSVSAEAVANVVALNERAEGERG